MLAWKMLVWGGHSCPPLSNKQSAETSGNPCLKDLEAVVEFEGRTVLDVKMANRPNRDQWMHDIEARQRNIVFPNTVENETRFWRNLGTGPSNIPAKVGLALLAIFVFSLAGVFLVATYKAGVIWSFLLAMLLLCAPIFGVIAWATRRSLRDIEKDRRDPKGRKR
jgi:hypothetical protein